MIALILFWGSLGLAFYVLVLFPLLVLARGRLFARPVRTGDATPTLSVIIAAHNEEENIAARIENLLQQDYPRERMEILIASDGSTDRTEEITAGYSDRGVKLLALPRGGKIAAMNRAAAESNGEILVFSDANCDFAADALRELVLPYADENVGGVAGNQVYTQAESKSTTAAGECSYWNFDRVMKRAQSRAGNVTSATGAIFAMRRSLYRPVPPGVTDDFVASTEVIAAGYRLVFAERAVSREPVAADAKTEFGRKVRVITQGFRAVWVMRRLLNPFRYGFYAFQLCWHKLLRRLLVLPMLLLLVSAALLWNQGTFYQVVLAVQCGFYWCAVLGLLLRGNSRKLLRPAAISFYVCMVNAAALLALVNSFCGRRIELWSPQRGTGASSSNDQRIAMQDNPPPQAWRFVEPRA